MEELSMGNLKFQTYDLGGHTIGVPFFLFLFSPQAAYLFQRISKSFISFFLFYLILYQPAASGANTTLMSTALSSSSTRPTGNVSLRAKPSLMYHSASKRLVYPL